MEKEIVWTEVAIKDFWSIVFYLEGNWPAEVLNDFHHRLDLKTSLLTKQPNLGFKSAKYSRFRQTLVTQHYKIIYSVTKGHIVIHRLKHARMR
jgi:plasmid stabilization system protein ParE